MCAQAFRKKRLPIALVAFSSLLFSCFQLSYAATATATAAATTNQAPKSVWDGSNANFGLNISSGNTNTQDLNSALNLIYTKNRWTNNTGVQIQFGKDTGVLNKEKYLLQDQLNIGFDPSNINSMFANGTITVDKFSPYDYVYSGAAGYAHKIIHTTTVTLTGQFGPGYSVNKAADTKIKTTQFIFQTAANLEWKIRTWGIFTQSITADFGKLYNHYVSSSKFTNAITKHVAIQLAYDIDSYSHIPPTKDPNTKKTDTTTSVNLVYNF